ncbi:AcrR family transcriptional regulator [Paenibacillus favisporus]|uniref:AcrR family transcriptional regulator n=1 Tax=Paenibacillus favisporus TaxID=221028 RepID=A0ABV2F058_9BACL
MDPKTRWEQERLEGKKARESSIIEAAERVFNRKGIDKATMRDIAAEDNVGIATVFRYFPKKDKLIVAVATHLISLEEEAFRAIAATPVTGIEKLEALLDHFLNLQLPELSSRSRFLEAFESYAAQQAEPLEDIQQYNDVHRKVSDAFAEIIDSCTRDGSVRSDLPIEETLSTVVNAFGIFSKKLSLQRSIVMFESIVSADVQLDLLKRMFLDYLRNPESAASDL